jgi:hypothetical protein
MPIMQRSNFDSPRPPNWDQSSLPAPAAQQGAITASHQRLPGPNQTNGLAAQIMRLPAAFGKLPPLKQNARQYAIAIALETTIERSHRKSEPPSPLYG